MSDKNTDFDKVFGDGAKKKPKEQEYLSERDFKPVRQSREGRTGCLGGVLFFTFVISVSVILACLGWMAATDVLALNASDLEATVVLPKDYFTYEDYEVTDDDGNTKTKTRHSADLSKVADALYDAGIVKYKWLFQLVGTVTNADEKIDPGTYTLKDVYDYKALVRKMSAGSSAMVTISITFPEGYNMRQIFNKLEENGVCDYDELMDAAANATFTYSFLENIEKGDPSRLEGFLFPDTYEFYEGMPASSAINRLLEGFYYKLTAEMLEWVEQSGYTMRQIVTVASMIEKEAANDSERATIASVIFNRLKDDWPLQIDSTTLYDYPEHSGAPTKEMLESDTPYNTRINKGLPPSPICSPGLASLRAAMRPESTSYYFYALDTEAGTHKFFRSSGEFDAFVATQNYD